MKPDKLVSLLRSNARMPISELARETGASEEAVSTEIARLEGDGVILGYQAIVDVQKIRGSNVTAFVEVRITPERGGGFDRLAARIARFDEVQSCYLMSGAYDLPRGRRTTSNAAGRFLLHLGEAQHDQRCPFDSDPFSAQGLQGEWRGIFVRARPWSCNASR